MGETAKLPDGSMFEFWEDETVYDIVLHVNSTHPDADDRNAGTLKAPLKTIQAAAERAVPGTRVLIHGGEYREWVHPVCGGINASHMISYEAYGDGEVVIKASEKVENFRPSNGWRLYNNFGKKKEEAKIKVWEYCLEPNLFLGYNPFCAVNILHDRLFIEYDKTDMTTYLNRRGMVFCDGKPLTQVSLCNGLGEKDGTYWVEANGQRVHFRLWNDEDPADHRIEVTCREQCFAPDEPFLSYIKVKGLTCAHAATGAPVPQRGAISCYRGHHWIIEDCTVDWSNGVGIDVGNECWHHEMIPGQKIGYSVIRNQTKEKFYEKLNMEYQKERNHDKWHPCTHLIKKDGKYYVYYRSGKNVYKWSVQYLEDQQIIELQHVWNIADYVMWIPLAAMDVFFASFCVFNKLWQYIPVLCMVIAVLEFLPYYVFVARLGENVVTKYIISCLEDKDL